MMISKPVEEFIDKHVTICLPCHREHIVSKLLTHPDSPVKQALDMAAELHGIYESYPYSYPDKWKELKEKLAALEVEK